MDIKNMAVIKSRGVFLCEGKFLAVKHGEHADFYATPGGHLDWPESPKECLEREIFEEIGIMPQVGKLLYVNNYNNPDGTNFFDFFFEIKNSADYFDINKFNGTHKDELFDVLWVGKDADLNFLPGKVFQDFKDGNIGRGDVQFIK